MKSSKTTASGSSTLPPGASTAANQVLQLAQETGIHADTTAINGKINNDYGASSGAVRTASQIGNTTGAASFNAGATGAQTLRVEANQGAANATPWNVTGPLTDTQLRATPVPVSGTVAATQSGTWNITNVSGTVSLPTGASTSALQTTGNTSLSSIDGKLADNYGVATAALRTASQIGNTSGAADFGAGATSAQTLRVVLPTDQTAIPVTSTGTANTNGSFAEFATLSTVQTFTVPANARGFLLETSSSNTTNTRWKIGAAATTTSGMILEPGRDTGYIPCAANISVIMESGTGYVSVQWVLSV